MGGCSSWICGYMGGCSSWAVGHYMHTYVWHTCTIRQQASYCTAWDGTVLHCSALHGTILQCMEPYCTALHGTVLHCTALHGTVLCEAILHEIYYMEPCCLVFYCKRSCCMESCCWRMESCCWCMECGNEHYSLGVWMGGGDLQLSSYIPLQSASRCVCVA